MWYAYVSIPIVQFVTFRWYYRLVLWARLLWKVSRIDLQLAPLHPDRTGGLGFLASLGYALTMFAVAHGATMAGYVASRIFLAGARLPDFAEEIAALVVFMVCVVFGPLLVFAPQLAAAKLTGLGKYGRLGERYVRDFDAKWLEGRSPPDEKLIGSCRHPVAGGPGQQLRGRADDAHRSHDDGRDPSTRDRDAGADHSAVAHDDSAERGAEAGPRLRLLGMTLANACLGSTRRLGAEPRRAGAGPRFTGSMT